MMRLLLAILFSLGVSTSYGQVSLDLIAPGSASVGDTIALEVEVTGFTDITSGQFEIQWSGQHLRALDASIPVDSALSDSPFTSSFDDDSATFLYIEESATVGGSLASGSILLRVELEVLAGSEDSVCIDVSTDRIGIEFIERAQTELDVSVQKASVHLRGSVATFSHEHTKLSPHWISSDVLMVHHGPLDIPTAEVELFDLRGWLVAHQSIDPSQSLTRLKLSTPAVGTPYVLRLVAGSQRHTLLIQGRPLSH